MEQLGKNVPADMTLEEKIGQMLVTGFPDGVMNESFLQLVHDVKVGNVILFRENQLNRRQLEQLCTDVTAYITKETGIAPFITSDEEGGIVSRLPEDLGKMPSAMAFSKMKSKEAAYKAAWLSGKQLKRLGINFNLAPVLDINNNVKNPVIGVRSYGQTPDEVWEYAGAAAKGYMDAGIMCVGKHFPGHGDTETDSHLALPVIKKSIDEMRTMELVPFQKAIDAGIPAVTIAHVVFEKEDNLPATMSKKIVTGLLREQMYFDGLIISDCMEMNAISRTYGIEEGAVRAVNAGIELIFISHFHDKVRTTAARIIEAVRTGEIAEETIDRAVSKILYYKEKYIGKNTGCVKKEDESIYDMCAAYSSDIYEAAVAAGVRDCNHFKISKSEISDHTRAVVFSDDSDGGYCVLEKKFVLGENPVFLSPVKQQISMVSNMPEAISFADEMQAVFGGKAMNFELNMTEEDAKSLAAAVKNATAIVVGSMNISIYEQQHRLIKVLAASKIPVACAALRDPFDLDILPDKIYKIPLYEYTKRSIDTAKKYFEVSHHGK